MLSGQNRKRNAVEKLKGGSLREECERYDILLPKMSSWTDFVILQNGTSNEAVLGLFPVLCKVIKMKP